MLSHVIFLIIPSLLEFFCNLISEIMTCFDRQVAYYLVLHFLLLLLVLNKSNNQPLFLNSNLYKPEYAFGEVPAKRVILYLLEDFEALEVINRSNKKTNLERVQKRKLQTRRR